MIAAMQRRSPFGNLRKKLRWDYVLMYLFVLTPFLVVVNFMHNASINTKTMVFVLWYAVPFGWLILAMIVGIGFEKQYGTYYNSTTHKVVHSKPLKRKLVLWFAPITLPYYIVKVSLMALWQHRSNIRSWIAQRGMKS